MSSINVTNIKHPSSASNNIVLDSSGGVDMDALTVSGSAPADSVNLDASGRLLVGTSTSRGVGGNIQSNLQIEGTGTGSDTTSCSVFQNSDTADGPRFMLAKSRSTSNGGVTLVQSGDSLGIIDFAGADGTDAGTSAVRISAQVDGTPGSNDMPGRLIFATTAVGAASPTERVRLSNSGNFYVYSSGNDTVVAGNAAGSGTAQSLFAGVHSRTSTTGGGTVAYRIYNNGTTFSVSDERQKKNIESTRDGYLEDLQQLRVVKYNWKDQADDEPKELGLIAQEVASVFPGLVQQADLSDPESTLGIKSSVFSFMLIKALQEAAAKIETLEAKVAALEAS